MFLSGAAELKALLDAYPVNVQKAAQRTGLNKAAYALRAHLIKAAPEKTGTLRKTIQVRRARGNKFTARLKVGLAPIKGEAVFRYYYKTLEFKTARGEAMRPFMRKEWDAQSEATSKRIIEETRKAVYTEAAKIHRKTLGLKGRRR